MTSSWFRAMAVLALSLLPAAAASPQSCDVNAEPSRRLELADGRIASVDVKSVAASGGSVMALGRYVYLFPRHSTPITSPLFGDSGMGVHVDATGAVSMVPSPMPDRSVVFARVAAGPAGTFHALFATGIDSVDSRARPGDTASLWYSRFANGAWAKPQLVMATIGAELDPEFTSGLLVHAGSLTFVFPFEEIRGERGGVIVLRGLNDRWSGDTLRTNRMPKAVRAAHSPGGDLVVLTSQQRFGGSAEEVHLWRPGSMSDGPRPIGAPGTRPVSDLALSTGVGGLMASWSTWEWLNATTNVLEWARITDERLPMPAILDSGRTTYPFELIAVGGRHPLWLYQGEPYGSTLSYALAANDDRVVRGRLTIPFHNARPKAVALTPEVIRVFTMKRGHAGAEPMIASFMTDLRIRCPSPAQR
jgi:hypothetical protein